MRYWWRVTDESTPLLFSGMQSPPLEEGSMLSVNFWSQFICYKPLGYKEFEETIETLLGHFLLYVVPGGKRLDRLQIAGEFPPDRWIFVRRRCPSCTPQNQERSRDLFVFVGCVHLEIDGRARAIIAASAADRLRREAAYEFVHHDFGSLPRVAAAVGEKPLRS